MGASAKSPFPIALSLFDFRVRVLVAALTGWVFYCVGSANSGSEIELAESRIIVKFITSYIRSITSGLSMSCLRMCSEVGTIKLVRGCVVPRCRILRSRDQRGIARKVVGALLG